jgi:hypothetical protein
MIPAAKPLSQGARFVRAALAGLPLDGGEKPREGLDFL